jgi:hypothetical protein
MMLEEVEEIVPLLLSEATEMSSSEGFEIRAKL